MDLKKKKEDDVFFLCPSLPTKPVRPQCVTPSHWAGKRRGGGNATATTRS